MQRDYKRKKDGLAFKAGRTAEKRMERDSKREEDELDFKAGIADKKKMQRGETKHTIKKAVCIL